MGKANAAVFPLPVSANPMISRPSRARGMDCSWMGVGALYPSFSHASHKESIIPWYRLDLIDMPQYVSYQVLKGLRQNFVCLHLGFSLCLKR